MSSMYTNRENFFPHIHFCTEIFFNFVLQLYNILLVALQNVHMKIIILFLVTFNGKVMVFFLFIYLINKSLYGNALTGTLAVLTFRYYKIIIYGNIITMQCLLWQLLCQSAKLKICTTLKVYQSKWKKELVCHTNCAATLLVVVKIQFTYIIQMLANYGRMISAKNSIIRLFHI